MLELKNIKKDYPAGDGVVHALKGINLKFRESEFVSILGPSGCGKTTMLNIIGGLDQCTDGDLIINSTSTKDFTDRDWDLYRNESIGFVFQSYNLIPHQTVMQNVELALTLSGVSKEERKSRVKKALQEVGLSDQLNKKPNEMSGGQMQRVAIARALVNNPDIILADEPTGALDTETSVQVMDILKEISKSRLVIMVTHNPELADKYSTRIIRMLDGNITDDSAPVTENEYKLAKENDQKKTRNVKRKKTSMSPNTAFALSIKNLMTKKGRTTLTAFAGSIGIIGIALILSLAQGFTGYIDTVQEDTLSSYPLTIESSVTDMSSLIDTIMGSMEGEVTHEKDAVYSSPITYDLINSLGNMETTENDLKSFKAFLESERADENSEYGLHDAISGIKYTYNLDLLTYTKQPDGTIIYSDPMELLGGLIGDTLGMDISSMMGGSGDMSSMMSMSGMDMSSMGMSIPGMSMTTWSEMLSGDNGKLTNDMLESQYDMVYGSWPNSYNEVVLVLDANNELDDLTLYALGLESTENMAKIMKAAMNGEEIESESKKWSYEEICSKEFRVVLNSSRYVYDEATDTYTDNTATATGMNYLYDNAIKINVSGIIRPKEDAMVAMISGSIGYTGALTEYVIEQSNSSDPVKAQLADKTTDVFTGLPFKTEEVEFNDGEKEATFLEYADSLSMEEKAGLYVDIMSTPTQEYLNSTIDQYLGSMTRQDLEESMIEGYVAQTGMDTATIQEYFASLDDETLYGYFREAMAEEISAQYALGVAQELAPLSTQELAGALDMALLPTLTTAQLAECYDTFMPAAYSEATLEGNLKQLGYVELDTPSSINIYASSFEKKDAIIDAIAAYNDSVPELERIAYTDLVGLMMSSITTIINVISYILIAFVAISLIVSSIMIAIITLISVQERTKEIGILRAIGASKRDVSSIFNEETMIIGFSAGFLGVGITFLLCFPINYLIEKLTGMSGITANLPWQAAVILVIISVVLTMLSGLIPARSAAKKDPVVALRTE